MSRDDGVAVEGDEGLVLARRGVVECARKELLAGAGFAGEQDGDVGRCEPPNSAEKFG